MAGSGARPHRLLALLDHPRTPPGPAARPVGRLAAGGGRGPAERTLAAVLARVEACGQVPGGAGFSDAL
ncbi:hypothetical protein [Streptomyces pseudovenezuelae]|uniref:hypothetical protein n=1 Tax=Streptomyces pseudovenezuelae TaxID=67350 RepID=UPI0039A414F6